MICEVPVFMKEAVEKDNSLFDVWATERSNSRVLLLIFINFYSI